MNPFYLAETAIFAPLVGFLIAGLVSLRPHLGHGEGSFWGDRFSQLITCCLMAGSVLSSVILFYKVGLGHQSLVSLYAPWIEVGNFSVHWGLKLDALSTTMMMVVTLVSWLVHIYSIGYMAHDHSIPRFMAYLSLFTFAMLVLVTAPNLVQLFFGWEGVGLASYLLIGFWYEKPSANAAAIKAFLVNRVGDIGLALGICAIFAIFQTVDYDLLFKAISIPSQQAEMILWGYPVDVFNTIGILLFIGAMGKSAQLGLHTWLPDAMEGPTPVSALIHAATMVTAGVFLIARMSPLYELAPFARQIIIVVGALTALFAALIALTQNDIKRIIAYSTCSQLGYMFFAAGVSAYGAAIFHLVTHAFFKGLLFLGAGAVIHTMSGEQDITRMGGIRRLVPKTYVMMWLGSLALAGVPFFSGYYSKEAILGGAYQSGTILGELALWIGLLVEGLTAFYAWRLLLQTFHGAPRADDRVMAHVHKAPGVMKVPMYILTLGAIVAGYLGHDLFLNQTFWNNALAPVSAPLHSVPSWVTVFSLVCISLGLTLAYQFYYKDRTLPEKLVARWKGAYLFLFNKGFVDELYDWLFVQRFFGLGQIFWKKGDEQVIDRFGPDGMTTVSLGVARLAARIQTGYVYHYAFAMLGGVILLTSWLLLTSLWK